MVCAGTAREDLSFKLMGIEYVGSHSHSLAMSNDSITHTVRKLIDTQKYLEKHSRDIIDESDENFSVKFEAILHHWDSKTF